MKTVTSLQWEQETGNLDKDPGSRRTEIKTLRNHVRHLENKAILQFLSHLLELPDGQMSRQYSISLYEILAKEHGKSIIPHISEIMGDVLKALSSNAPSLALQQACAKVVSALARYTIDSSSFEGQREGIIRDLSNPLLQVLLGSGGTLAGGAAMCLQALVESEAWKFAPKDVLNNVCSLVTAALEEKETRTANHMKLVCFLANSNSESLEVYGRLLIRAAQQILEIGAAEGNWRQCLYAVQMINSLFKYADAFYFAPEIPNTIQILEGCRSDRMPSLRNGISETLKIAKAIASETSMRSICKRSSSDEMDFYAWANRFRHFGAEQSPHSNLMDNVALPEKEGGSPFSTSSQIGESLTPNNGQEMDARQASHPISGHRVKDGECSAHVLQKSTLFENEGSSNILLKNGIVGGSHAEVTARYESDDTYRGNFLLGQLEEHRKNTSDNFDEHEENGDALSCQKDREKKPTYSEAQNEEAAPRLRPGYVEEAAFSSHARNEEAAARLRPAYREEAVFTPQVKISLESGQNPNSKEEKRMDGVTSLQWQQEFANLDKDPGSRRAAIKALKNYVRQLDNKAIPQFLFHLSELPDGQMSRQYSISLCEVIVKRNGKSIIPHIREIMGNVLKALSSNAPSLALQRACAKVVSALARYTIDPSSFEDQREGIIRELSNPLLVLLRRAETLAEGAAMCLQALVESEAWKFAPKDVVYEVCLFVTAAFKQKGIQTTSHMKLVCLLAYYNSLILQASGIFLIKAAHQTLEIGAAHGNWQQRLYAIRMIYSLLKYMHVYYIISEIPKTIQVLERYRFDRMLVVRKAVSEALHIARFIAYEFYKSYSIYNSSSSNEEIPLEGWKSWRSRLGGSADIFNDTQIDSYTYSLVSSRQSLNSKCQTPLMLGCDARANRSSRFCAKQGPRSPSMDNVTLPEKEGNSSFSAPSRMCGTVTPKDGQEVDAKQACHPFSGHRVKHGGCSGNMLHKSLLFENEGSGSISLKNGIVGGSDAEVTGQYGSDGTCGRNFLLIFLVCFALGVCAQIL